MLEDILNKHRIKIPMLDDILNKYSIKIPMLDDILNKHSIQIPMLDAVNLRRTENTMVKRKRTKGQTNGGFFSSNSTRPVTLVTNPMKNHE
jgi:hypothetical protein